MFKLTFKLFDCIMISHAVWIRLFLTVCLYDNPHKHNKPTQSSYIAPSGNPILSSARNVLDNVQNLMYCASTLYNMYIICYLTFLYLLGSYFCLSYSIAINKVCHLSDYLHDSSCCTPRLEHILYAAWRGYTYWVYIGSTFYYFYFFGNIAVNWRCRLWLLARFGILRV